MAGTGLHKVPDYEPVKQVVMKVQKAASRVYQIVLADLLLEDEWPEWMKRWAEWSHYLITGPMDFFDWWYEHMPFIGMLLETISLITIVWNAGRMFCRWFSRPADEVLFSERAAQTDKHWNRGRNRYYYGHASVLWVVSRTRDVLQRMNLARGQVMNFGNNNMVNDVVKKPSQRVLELLGLSDEANLRAEQALAGVGREASRPPPTAPEIEAAQALKS